MLRSLGNGKTIASISAADIPIGEIFLVATNKGISHLYLPGIEFREEVHATPADIEDTPENELKRERILQYGISELKRYFLRETSFFDVPIDYGEMTEFRLKVLSTLREVLYRDVITYKDLAVASGHPKASQAVGTVCARNPLPILIPCHRVVKSGGNGDIGRYAGGDKIKKFLLELEEQDIKVGGS